MSRRNKHKDEDIVVRLRDYSVLYSGGENWYDIPEVCTDAADEIESLRAQLTALQADRQFPIGTTVTQERDGFVGTVIGHYTTLEGHEGSNVQQNGTKVVHLYRDRWLTETKS